MSLLKKSITKSVYCSRIEALIFNILRSLSRILLVSQMVLRIISTVYLFVINPLLTLIL